MNTTRFLVTNKNLTKFYDSFHVTNIPFKVSYL